MQPDSFRGSPLESYAGMSATTVCLCSHQWANHLKTVGVGGAITQCMLCACNQFVAVKENNYQMANDAKKAAEANGFESARRIAALFEIRRDATYEAKVEYAMEIARTSGLTLDTGAAFVTGFVNGIDSRGKSSVRALSLEEKLERYLESQLDNRLSSGADSSRNVSPDSESEVKEN